MSSSLKTSAASPAPIQGRGLAEVMVDLLTPVLIWLMLLSICLFLLDVRWVYSEVFHNNLRWFCLAFVTLIVALNRLVARDGHEESVLYVGFAIIVVGLYIMGLQVYGTGSVAPGFMDGPYAVLLHMGVAGFIWVFANRLIHECCIDDNPYAGDVGLLRNSAAHLQRALRDARDPRRPRDSIFVRRQKDKGDLDRNVIEPWEPDKVFVPKRPPRASGEAPERFPKRHPGVSIFYFSIPVIAAFTLGLPVIQHGGWPMIFSGYLYLVIYCTCALMLLLLTSLGGFREFFRARQTYIPEGLTAFWLVLGVIQVTLVLVAASAIPRPEMPGLAHVPFHQVDLWSRSNSDFQPLPVVLGAAEMDRQYRIMDTLGNGVLGVFIAIVVFAALRGLGLVLFEILSHYEQWPRWLVHLVAYLDAALERITSVPTLPTLPRLRRISRAVATSTAYTNPLADPETRGNTNAVIAHSYEALCALAYDLGVPRHEGETPYEFLERFPRELRSIKSEARELTEFFVLSQYADQHFTQRSMDRLRRFWLSYEKARRQVVR